jgi:prolyl-tRNA synthetase
MATIVELHHDKSGILWPDEVAPFKVHLIKVGKDNPELDKQADKLYKEFLEKGIEVLYDDRELMAGEKFAESDLIGCPYRVIISTKTLLEGKAEIKKRKEEKFELVKLSKVIDAIS